MAEIKIPKDLYYTLDDEWVREEDGRVVFGITDYAQQQLGDIVFVELPEVGTTVAQGDPFGVIESVKAVSDLVCPITGEVVETNGDLADRPETVNHDCYGDGWMCAIAPSEDNPLEALLDHEEYRTHVEGRLESDS